MSSPSRHSSSWPRTSRKKRSDAHHFGSKLGLYDAVRGDVERRLTDRMEGALGAQRALAPALVVAFDYAQRASVLRLVGEPHPGGGGDPIAALLSERAGAPLGAMLAAAWRQGLLACAEGAAPTEVRAALRALTQSELS